MVSYLSWAANAVLFVAACFLAANTANTIFAAMLAPPEREEVATARPALAPAARWNDREVILQRNLFNATTLEAAAGGDDLIDEDIEATTLPLRLLGTAAAASPELAWAAVEDEETRKTLVVTIGDILKDQATVVRIERRRIVLLENDVHRELTFGDEEEGKPLVRSARRPSRPAPQRVNARAGGGDPRLRQVADNRFALPRGDVEEVLRNPTNILSQARFLPKYDGQEMVGFQINAIKRGSVLEEFGLRDGDVITEFNGISIDSPTESARLLQEFNESDQVSLVVTGPDGESRQIDVDLD